MSDLDKITEQHRRRRAIVYVRQSTPGQVKNNHESRALSVAMKTSPWVAIETPRWWPPFLPMGGHGFSPRFCPEGPVVGRALLSTRDLRRADREESGGSDADFGGV